jgi:hypothetical protein
MIMTKEEKRLARERANAGTAETPADAPASAEQAPSEQVASAPQDNPPDAQEAATTSTDVASLDSDALKRMWKEQASAIDAAEAALKSEQGKRVAISTVLARRALDARKAATGKEKGAKIEIDGHKYRPRKRDDGDGYDLSRIDDSAADV